METKQCFKCGSRKFLEDFYRHPAMADGHLNKCKECTKDDVSTYLRKKTATPEGLARERERGREKYHRLYALGKPGYKLRPRIGPNWKSPPSTRKQQIRAHNALSRAVRSGKILKGTRCEDCGMVPRYIHGHHEDYSKPLAVSWVCSTCHRRRHATHPERVKLSPGNL